MPEMIKLVAAVAIVTEFLKATLRRFGVDPTQALKVILACIGSVAVVGFFAIQTQAAFTIDLLWILGQVIASSVFGYKIAMKFRAKPK